MRQEYLDRLAAALQTHAPDETILVCSSRAEGRRLLAAIAARGYVLVGVRAETPFSLAQELCAPLADAGNPARLLDAIEGAEYIRASLDQNTGIYSGVNAKTLLATRTFFYTFQDLSLAGFTPETMKDHPALKEYPKLVELHRIWQEYDDIKRKRNLQDRADRLNMALQAVSLPENASLRRAHYVTLGDFAPSIVERELLNRLTADGNLAVVELPCAKDLSARSVEAEGQYLPEGAMAEQVPRMDALEWLKGGDHRFVACRGVETEVQFPLRDILERKLPLEDCAIVYLGSGYAQSLYEEAGRFHLPVTVGGGLPMVGSRLYTTLKQAEQLPNSDFLAEQVCQLLETGSCTPQWPVSLAERMRKKQVGWSRERYELAYEYEDEEIGKPKPLSTEAWKDLLADWKRFLTLLLAVAQPTDALEQQRTDMLDFLDYCAHQSAGEGSACLKAKELTRRIIALEVGETLLQRLLRLMETTSYLSGGPEPGALYIAPLAQAACIDRPNLYILGFSRYALQGSRRESPVLLDDEREALGGLKTSIQKGREQEFRLLTLLIRHCGRFVLTYPDFTSEHMLDQKPAPFFRDAAGGKVEHVTYLPETAQFPVDELLRHPEVELKAPTPAPIDDGEAAQLQPEKKRREQLSEVRCSATALESALHCPCLFYLKHVMHVRSPQPVERDDEHWLDSMTMGSFCHTVLEKYYMPNNDADLDTIFEAEYVRLKRDVPMPQPHLEADEKALLHTFVERAVAWTQAEERTVLATEADFLLPFTFGDWTINLKGSIDRVDQLKDGSYAILDYKTGNPDHYKKEMFRHWQHYLYTLAEEQQSGKDIRRAGYLFLREEAELVEQEETDAQRQLLEKRIEWLLDRISAEDYALEHAPGFHEKVPDPANPAQLPDNPWELEAVGEFADLSWCRNCEFNVLCQKGGVRP